MRTTTKKGAQVGKRVARVGMSVLLALALGTGLVGCSKSSKMTCQEYGQLSDSAQLNAVMSMIREHGFDPNSSALGTAKIASDVDMYCGIGISGSAQASKNLGSPIESAINWSSLR